MPARSHGRTRTKEHDAWKNIKQRCYNPKNKRYKDYGGRGITMCDRWRDSFEAFLADVGLAPSPKHTLERIDNDGNYEPSNVQWATQSEQQVNRRSNVVLTAFGCTQPLTSWARELGIHPNTLFSRLYRRWPVERILREASQRR